MKEAEYYRKIGYEDHGYVSPELSSSEIYPEYIKKEVKESIKEIQRCQNSNTITFAFITDIHYALSYNHEIRMKRTVNAYREIAKRAHIDKLILGGDYTNEGCKEYKAECFRELRAQLDGIDYFPVNGNHDDGTIWDVAYIKSQESVNHFTHDELYVLFYNHIEAKGAKRDKNNKSLYYFIDDDISKTRYICLDSGDIPYVFDDNGKLLYNGQWLFSMSDKQLQWLINEALVFNEEGWTVMFFLHSSALPGKKREELGDIRIRMAVLNDIICAFKTGGKFKYDSDEKDFEIHVSVDFSNYKKADIAGVFVGDYHTDKIETDKCGTPYILTGNAVMYSTSSPSYVQRRDGDKSELLFDVVTVDKAERMIYVTRVGGGENRKVKY